MKKKKKKKKGTTAAAKVNRTKSRSAISWTMPNRRFKPVFFFPSQLDEEYVQRHVTFVLADGPRRRSRRQFSDNFGTYNAHVSLFLSSSSSSASLNGEAKKNGPLSFIKTTTKLPFFSNVAVSSLRRKGENMKRNFFLIWFYFFADCFHRRGLGAGGQAGKHKETLFLLLFFSAAASKWKRNGSRKLEFDRR